MKKKILVVDDDKQVKAYLSKVLSEVGGFSVDVAETAEKAHQKIRAATYDLVLVDLIDFHKLEELHTKIHNREIVLIAYEIDRCIPTWRNYVSGLLKYFGCEKVLT